MDEGAMLAEWVRVRLGAVGPAEVARDRTWRKTSRITTAGGTVRLKETAPLGNPPELWQRLLPQHAELQRDALAPSSLPAAIQHDDLHHENAFVDGKALRVIDWADASCLHPFVSLVVPFRFLEERAVAVT